MVEQFELFSFVASFYSSLKELYSLYVTIILKDTRWHQKFSVTAWKQSILVPDFIKDAKSQDCVKTYFFLLVTTATYQAVIESILQDSFRYMENNCRKQKIASISILFHITLQFILLQNIQGTGMQYRNNIGRWVVVPVTLSIPSWIKSSSW